MDKVIISLGLAMNTTPWSVAAEYFRLFRHGTVDEEKPIGAASVACDALVQQHFLRTTMSQDMSDGTMHGLEGVIQSWKFMSRCFDNIDIVPLRLENGPGGMLVANCKCNLTITENTLRLAFPQLLRGQVGSKFSSLAANIVGKILAIQGTMHLCWDAEIGRMTSVTWQVDLVKPLLELVGSIEDVSRVFNHALIAPDCSRRVLTDCELHIASDEVVDKKNTKVR
ncbi:hypothetical protein V7S43_001639 [Phytophthora oleae]|uniref:Bzip transcription factor n=1 Tax=Phytophthora oleae TaxID=2107226 RepID=A0ABD3G4A0_9STRA